MYVKGYIFTAQFNMLLIKPKIHYLFINFVLL